MHNHRTGRVVEVLVADKVVGEVLVVGLVAPAALVALVDKVALAVEDVHPPLLKLSMQIMTE